MNIDELTIGQAKELGEMFYTPPKRTEFQTAHPYTLGGFYFVRTVTHIVTGKLLDVYPTELVLTDAAWIADTGRYADAIASGEFAEVEPYPEGQEVIVGRGAIIDVTTLPKLPREQK